MNLVKTSFFSAIITIIRISSGFISNKIIAIFAGTSGIAIVGAFTNFISIVLTFANGAISSGVVKYTAEYNDDDVKLKQLFSTALKITLFCSLIIGILLFTLSSFCSNLIFNQKIYSQPIRILGLSIVFYALNTLLISILNGKNQIKKYTIVNTVGSILGLVLTIVLVYFYKIQGALYSLVLAQSLVFFVTAVFIIKSDWFSLTYFNQSFNRSIGIKLSHYSLMAIVTALTVPVSQILLRNLVISKFGLTQAGNWQGMLRISDAYLMLITTALSTYFLPKLASINSNNELRIEILKGYRIVLPMIFIGCISIYFFRFILIKLLFTLDFSAMEHLFFWQLIGDFFKMTAWILAYIMLAKSMTKMYVITEIFFNVGYVVLGYLFTDIFHLQGVVIAFAVNYFFYFLFMLFVFRKIVFNCTLN